MRFGGGVWGLVCGLCVVVWVRGSFGACCLCVWVFVFLCVCVCVFLFSLCLLPSLWLLCVPLFGCVLRFRFCCVFLCGFLCFNGFPFAVLKNRRILHESACMLAGGCTPKWAQLGRKSQFTGSFWRQPELTVPTVLLSEKYSCTDHASTIAKHFPYGTSVCSSLTSENFGQNRYRKSSHWDLVCTIQYEYSCTQ